MAAQAADGAAAAAGVGIASTSGPSDVVPPAGEPGNGVAPMAAPRPAHAQDLGRGWATTGRLASTSQTRGLPRTGLEHLVRQCVTEFYVGKKVEQGRFEYNCDTGKYTQKLVEEKIEYLAKVVGKFPEAEAYVKSLLPLDEDWSLELPMMLNEVLG